MTTLTKAHQRTVRIALVDSHPIMRAGLRAVMSTEEGLELITESSDLDDSLHQIASLDVEVVILGMRKPVEQGIRDLQKLREQCPNVAPIVFTGLKSAPCLVQTLMAGARAYVLSDYGREELVDAVRTAQRGKSVKVPSDLFLRVIRGLPTANENSPLEMNSGAGLARLTARETEVLKYMATGARYRTIADKLFLAESTVKKYAHSVITKLGAANRSTAVINAHRFNLLNDIDTDPRYSCEATS